MCSTPSTRQKTGHEGPTPIMASTSPSWAGKGQNTGLPRPALVRCTPSARYVDISVVCSVITVSSWLTESSCPTPVLSRVNSASMMP